MKKWSGIGMLALATVLAFGIADAQAASRGNGPGDGVCQLADPPGDTVDQNPLGAMFRAMFGWRWLGVAQGFGLGRDGSNGGFGPGDGTGDGVGPQDGTGYGAGNGDGDGVCDGSGTGICDGSGRD